MALIGVNLLPVLAAAIAGFVVGFLWHGPLFGKQWMKLSGITEAMVREAQKHSMAPRMLVAFAQQIVTAFALALLLNLTGMTDMAGALTLASWLWLGFIATTLLNGVLWEKRTPALYTFNIVYHLVSLWVMAAVLALWK